MLVSVRALGSRVSEARTGSSTETARRTAILLRGPITMMMSTITAPVMNIKYVLP